ncbi:hypothetical protein AB0L49_13350 [Streptomyces antimycoticus]|uniref:hypothetical protein n=1 Tax=Streptomyces antimycoticus TaxID=68175 RepID=UPI003446CFD8
MAKASGAGLLVGGEPAGLVDAADAIAEVRLVRVRGAEVPPGADLLVPQIQQIALVVTEPQATRQLGGGVEQADTQALQVALPFGQRPRLHGERHVVQSLHRPFHQHRLILLTAVTADGHGIAPLGRAQAERVVEALARVQRWHLESVV